jgi:hypothetical protein
MQIKPFLYKIKGLLVMCSSANQYRHAVLPWDILKGLFKKMVVDHFFSFQHPLKECHTMFKSAQQDLASTESVDGFLFNSCNLCFPITMLISAHYTLGSHR